MTRLYGMEGLSELERELKRTLPKALQGDALVEILEDGAEPILQSASAKAPRRTGQLAGSMVTDTVDKGVTFAEIAAGPSKDGFYGHFQEFIHGNPFLRPAFDQERRRAVQIIRKGLEQRLERAAGGPL